MKAYIINLAADTARRAAMERVIAGSPFAGDYEFIPAVNGRAMNAAQLRRTFDYDGFASRHVGRVCQGEVGCALSHHSAWQIIAGGRVPAMVLEDDLYFDGEWDEILSFAQEWLRTDKPRALLLPRHFFYRPGLRVGLHEVARALMPYGGECYMLNPAGARLLLSLGRPHYLTDEWDYFRHRGLDVRAIIPHPVVLQPDTQSNIAAARDKGSRQPWSEASRICQPGPLLFDFLPTAWLIFRHKAGLLKKYLSKSEL